MALLAGTDLECGAGSWAPGAPDSFPALGDAVKQGLVKESDVDRALRRLLRAQMRLGVYDPPQRLPWAGYTYETVVNSPKHQQLALEAARESIVLLKNEGAALPLKKGLGSHRRDRPERRRRGGARRQLQRHAGRAGHRPGRDPAAAGPGTKVTFARGGPLATGLPDLHVVPGSALSTGTGADRQPGLAGRLLPRPLRRRARPCAGGRVGRLRLGRPRPGGVARRRLVQRPVDGRYRGAGHRPVHPRACAARRSAASWSATSRWPRAAPTTSRARSPAPWRCGRAASYPIRLELEHEKYDAIAQLLWETAGWPRRRGRGGGGGRAGRRRGRVGAGPQLPPRGRGDARADRGLLRRRPHEPRPAEGPAGAPGEGRGGREGQAGGARAPERQRALDQLGRRERARDRRGVVRGAGGGDRGGRRPLRRT